MVEYLERDFGKLYTHIMTKNRFIYSENITKILKKIEDSFVDREEIIESGSLLYRAQKGCDYHEEIPVPYDHDRMFPLEDSIKEGRANPKGISYIYLANKDYIAISEVRSWKGDLVSLGYFTNNKDLRVIDFSSNEDKSVIIDFKNNKLLSNNSIKSTFAEINNAFSRPITSTDDKAEYAMTQIIAELVKMKGYDGLYYNSGYSRDQNEGKNLVVFNKKNLELKRVGIYEIKEMNIKFEECNNACYYK